MLKRQVFFLLLPTKRVRCRRIRSPLANLWLLSIWAALDLLLESFQEGNDCWLLIFMQPGAEKNHSREVHRRDWMLNLISLFKEILSLTYQLSEVFCREAGVCALLFSPAWILILELWHCSCEGAGEEFFLFPTQGNVASVFCVLYFSDMLKVVSLKTSVECNSAWGSTGICHLEFSEPDHIGGQEEGSPFGQNSHDCCLLTSPVAGHLLCCSASRGRCF